MTHTSYAILKNENAKYFAELDQVYPFHVIVHIADSNTVPIDTIAYGFGDRHYRPTDEDSDSLCVWTMRYISDGNFRYSFKSEEHATMFRMMI